MPGKSDGGGEGNSEPLTWDALYAFCLYDLSLSLPDTDRLTFPLFNALVERSNIAHRREELLAGTVISWLTAPHLRKPLKPTDIFPEQRPKPQPMTPDAMRQALRKAATQ